MFSLIMCSSVPSLPSSCYTILSTGIVTSNSSRMCCSVTSTRPHPHTHINMCPSISPTRTYCFRAVHHIRDWHREHSVWRHKHCSRYEHAMSRCIMGMSRCTWTMSVWMLCIPRAVGCFSCHVMSACISCDVQAISGVDLKYTLYGKPERVTYQYAEKMLLER